MPFMLSVANKPIMMSSVFMLRIVMLNVMAPFFAFLQYSKNEKRTRSNLSSLQWLKYLVKESIKFEGLNAALTGTLLECLLKVLNEPERKQHNVYFIFKICFFIYN
jgi:hypothetical protein